MNTNDLMVCVIGGNCEQGVAGSLLFITGWLFSAYILFMMWRNK